MDNDKTPVDQTSATTPTIVQPPVIHTNTLDLSEKGPSPSKVRLLSVLLMMAAILTFPPVMVVVWLIVMKHYKLSALQRTLIILISAITGPVLIFFGILTGFNPEGFNYYLILAGILLTIAPMIFSIIKPSSSKIVY